jgi:putative phosphoribosyl transferase
MRAELAATRDVEIGPHRLPGLLRLPEAARGLVIFAHGSGSSRFSRRNNFVAAEFAARGLGTLLFDLLSEVESEDRRNVFDIALLGGRMLEAIDWAQGDAPLPLGLFGASTGAAAALVAAAQRPQAVAAVVSRGGRPDLAGAHLAGVRAPTLLIVGGDDEQVLALNRAALQRLSCERSLAIVPGATHLFEEPGTLERVVELAADWFLRHLPAVATAAGG